jgi:putative DNA primase/helicase
VTIGGRWPDGSAAQTGDVAIWSGEDDPADTLLPRLLAAGADPKRVHFVAAVRDADGTRPFAPAEDMPALSDALSTLPEPPALLIVDPVVSVVGGDSHKNAEVRHALQPLVDLAQRHRCAVLGISHFSKGTAGRDPVERVTGSLGFGALARVVMATATRADEDGGGRLLARAKSNLGPDGGGYVYDMETCQPISGIETTRILWREALDGSARELLASAEAVTDGEERSAMDEAREFLMDELAAGPMPSKDVLRDARQMGIADKTLRRAQKALGVIAEKAAFQGGGAGDCRTTTDPAKVAKMARRCPTLNRGHLQGRWPSSASRA